MHGGINSLDNVITLSATYVGFSRRASSALRTWYLLSSVHRYFTELQVALEPIPVCPVFIIRTSCLFTCIPSPILGLPEHLCRPNLGQGRATPRASQDGQASQHLSGCPAAEPGIPCSTLRDMPCIMGVGTRRRAQRRARRSGRGRHACLGRKFSKSHQYRNIPIVSVLKSRGLRIPYCSSRVLHQGRTKNNYIKSLNVILVHVL